MQEAIVLAEMAPYVPAARDVITTLYPDTRPHVYIFVSRGCWIKFSGRIHLFPLPELRPKLETERIHISQSTTVNSTKFDDGTMITGLPSLSAGSTT